MRRRKCQNKYLRASFDILRRMCSVLSYIYPEICCNILELYSFINVRTLHYYKNAVQT